MKFKFNELIEKIISENEISAIDANKLRVTIEAYKHGIMFQNANTMVTAYGMAKAILANYNINLDDYKGGENA